MKLSASLLAVALVAACASEVPPRTTIQHDAIAKTDLEGEFYFRQTVVGVPYTTGFTFIGEQGENQLDRIKWDVQEKLLVARRATEYVRGSEADQPSQQTADGYLGAPVAAFRIESHFDIVREYNATTGEEYDRLVENTERKWFERKFIRVDWSENLITSFDFLVDWSRAAVENIRQDPAPYYVSDPADPDHMRLERPSADAAADYLEVTQKIVASPESVDFEDWGNVPLCWLEYSTQDCASQEIKIRLSFKRAAPSDYEPLRYDDKMMEKFGFFTTDRVVYNRQYGQTESGRLRLVNRFNLWRHSMSAMACAKDADCGEAAPGRRCVLEIPDAKPGDDGIVRGRCSLPFTVRNLADPANPASADLGPKPIVYFLNDNFPADLKDVARQVGEDYDAAFKHIVETDTGKPVAGRAFVLCANNPVQAGDPAECGPVGTHARIGDLRFNMLFWVDNPTAAGLLGYGPSSSDPDTGETMQGLAFVYGAEIDQYAAEARDIVKLVNGDLSREEFVNGDNVRAWVGETGTGRRRSYDHAEREAAGARMNLKWTAGLPETPKMKKAPAAKLAEMRMARSRALASTNVLGAEPGLSARRLSKLSRTDVPQRLADVELLLAGGIDPRTKPESFDPATMRALELANPERYRKLHRHRSRLGAHAVDLAPSFDDAIYGFALAQKGKDPNEVWRLIRAAVFRSTASHELGHSVGLRHNFAGSYDAMNYPKTYWDLRTANGTKTPEPRFVEPESAAERDGIELAGGLRAGISEFETSSVMDYSSRFNSDTKGLYRYDLAALKFGYGGLVEVFDEVEDMYSLGALQATVTYGIPEPMLIDCAGDNFVGLHYSKLPTIVNLEKRSDVHYSTIGKRELRGTGCLYPDIVELDTKGRIAVPYKFCSDEFESSSPDCSAYDRGADMFEITSNVIQQYRDYYLFNNFRRDRLGFGGDGYIDRIYWRYLDPLRNQMQFYTLFRADYADFIADGPNSFWRSPSGWGGYTLAVQDGFDLLGDIITTPEPGSYNKYETDDGSEAWFFDEYAEEFGFTLGLPRARFLTTSWEYDSGYFWYDRVSHVGVFLDKVAAMYELTDPETGFLGKDAGADLRQYAINYYRLYPEQMRHLFGSMLTDRWDRFAPVWNGEALVDRPLSSIGGPLDAGQLPIDPQLSFSAKLWASTLSMALVPATYDQSFADSSRIWLKGSGAAIDPAWPTVEFDDPFGGKTYVALSYVEGGVERGIGAQMLERANELATPPLSADSEAALRSHIEVIEVSRTIAQAYVDLPR